MPPVKTKPPIPFNDTAAGNVNMTWQETPQQRKTVFLSLHLQTVLMFLFDSFSKGKHAKNSSLSNLVTPDSSGGFTFHFSPCPFDRQKEVFLYDQIDTVLEKDIETFFGRFQEIKKASSIDSPISDVTLAMPQHYPSRVLHSESAEGIFDLFEAYMDKYDLKCLDQMATKPFDTSINEFHVPPGLSESDFTLKAFYALPIRPYISRSDAFSVGVQSFMFEPFPFSINQLRALHAQSQLEDVSAELAGYHIH